MTKKVDEQEKELQSQEAQEESYKDQFLRAQADLQNIKRRIDLERPQWILQGKMKVLEAVLPLIDELDLALKQAEKAGEEVAQWVSGFQLMQQNLEKRLKEIGLQEIDCSGDFNPELHEALVTVEEQGRESGQIVAVLSRGFMLDDKVVRHAKVSVAK